MIELFNIVFSWCRPGRLFRWMFFLLALLTAWVALNYSTLQKYFAIRERRNTYRESVARLEREKKRLTDEQEALRAGGFPAEKAVRERSAMVRPGEQVIIMETPAIKAKVKR